MHPDDWESLADQAHPPLQTRSLHQRGQAGVGVGLSNHLEPKTPTQLQAAIFEVRVRFVSGRGLVRYEDLASDGTSVSVLRLFRQR